METEVTESQSLMKKTSCAFTGHRPTRFSFKYDETHPSCIELKKVLAEQIDFLYRQGITDFYTGCALGIDLWAGEAVLALMELHPEIKLHCVVPFAAQDRKWTPEQQARYRALLDRSSDVFMTQEKYSEDCYYIRNRYLVDHADVVLAVYDMQANKRSGTGYTIHYAQAQSKPIIVIDPDDLHISFSGSEAQKKYFNFFQKFCDQRR
ncbi:MAG: DUF1273 family protein [Oscillospiraceae bacterium]|nr:DUF1273 family protein [Oscillospiraceae bacterium]